MTFTIYKISSKVYPDRIYIGSTSNFIRRKTKHISELRSATHHNQKLLRHVKKYGLNDLEFSIIDTVDNGRFEREQYYIDLLKPLFNVLLVAGSAFGFKHSKKSKEKMSFVQKGSKKNRTAPCSEESKMKISVANTGKRRTEEQKNNIRNSHTHSWKGKKHSVETIEKMKLAQKGRIIPEEVKQKMRLAKLGKKQNPEDIKIRIQKSIEAKWRKKQQRLLEDSEI